MFWKKKAEPQYKGRINHPIARLLFHNNECAMTVKKIAEVTKMNENTVRSMLRRLMDDGYVAHTKPFFYWK